MLFRSVLIRQGGPRAIFDFCKTFNPWRLYVIVRYMVKKLMSKSEFARLAGVSPAAVTKALRSTLRDAEHGKRIDAAHPAAVKYLQDKADATTPVTDEPATGIDPLYEAAVAVCRSNNRYTKSNIARGCKIGFARAEKILGMIKASGLDKKAPPPDPAPKPARVDKGHRAKQNTKEAESLADLKDELENGSVIHDIPEDLDDFVDMTLREILQRFGTKTAFLDWLKATKSIEDINEKRLKNAQTRGELVNRDLIKVGVIEPFDTAFNKLLTDGAKTIARRVSAMNGAGRSVADCEKFVADQISSFIKPAKAKIARTLKNA